ncbi:antibiotic biosynthesis monooxygenase family protein [Kitasatospora phosalacinea]|uniref:antibiotic biosynthesis monooxygenase family protein n=1 Tax=Kitasatospora phosalacinea TaxID=2065 RepID=UPI00365B590D
MINFITTFTLRGDDAEAFEQLFKEHTEFMSAQPGFLGFRMLKSLSKPGSYVNVGVWADSDAHRAVVSTPEFTSHVRAMSPYVEVTADLYTEIASHTPTAD